MSGYSTALPALPAIRANGVILVGPSADGTNGQALVTDGSGNLSFATGGGGADGEDGASAYEVAVANGFVGDESAWLASLVGADGADGSDGRDGLGWTGGSYNAGTGIVTFASTDGLGFSTGDLRGADGADGADGAPGADGADGQDADVMIATADAKTEPADADTFGLIDSADSSTLKKLSWANIKATLKTYFDTLYGPKTAQQVVFLSSTADDATAALGVIEFVATEDMSLTSVEFRCDTDNTPTGSAAQVDLRLNGTTIFSTNPTIDAGESSSTTAATAPVLSSDPTAISAGDKLEFDLDQVGASDAGKGYYAILYYTRSNS